MTQNTVEEMSASVEMAQDIERRVNIQKKLKT